MAWNRSTLPEIIARVENDFAVKFFGGGAVLRRSTLRVLARVWAGLVYLVHLFLSWVYDQGFAHLADDDQMDRHGQEVGVYRKAATFAEGLATFTGTPGRVIPQETRVQHVGTGNEYQTTVPAEIGGGGSVLVLVTALEAGAAGNLDPATELGLLSPMSGVDDLVEVVDGLSGGSDLEEAEPYRARILYKKRNPPQGGSDADYIGRATSVAPVTDAWVFPNFPEANSVTVRVANYLEDPPTLTGDEVAGVLASLTDRTWKPVTADVRVASVVPVVVDIAAQIRPNNATTRAAARLELVDVLTAQGKANGAPGAPGTTIVASQIQDAVAGAAGITGALLGTITQGGVVVDDVALNLNQVAVLGVTTFTEWGA